MLGSVVLSQHAYRQRIKSPVEVMIGASAPIGGPIPPANWCALEGMGGLCSPRAQGAGRAAGTGQPRDPLARHNFAETVASGQIGPLADRLPLSERSRRPLPRRPLRPPSRNRRPRSTVSPSFDKRRPRRPRKLSPGWRNIYSTASWPTAPGLSWKDSCRTASRPVKGSTAASAKPFTR